MLFIQFFFLIMLIADVNIVYYYRQFRICNSKMILTEHIYSVDKTNATFFPRCVWIKSNVVFYSTYSKPCIHYVF